MSPRRANIYSTMARKQQTQLSRIANELNQETARQLQQFDMADRLQQMLDETTLHAASIGAPMTLGQLTTAHSMGQMLVKELERTHQELDAAQERQTALKRDMAQVGQRERILKERAEEARRAAMVENQDKQDQMLLENRRR